MKIVSWSRIPRYLAYIPLTVWLALAHSKSMGSQAEVTPAAHLTVALAGSKSAASGDMKQTKGRAGETTPLTRIKPVRALSKEQVARLRPVILTGVVTVVSGYKNSFFLQDATGGISVDRTDSAVVHVGDEVKVIGTSSPAMFAPIVLASAVQVLGRGWPPPARPVTYADLIAGGHDSEWIEVRGVVHSAQTSKFFGHDMVDVSVELGGGPMDVMLQDFTGYDYVGLIDSTVRVRGVYSPIFNSKRQFLGLAMFVPDRKDIEVLEASRGDLFDGPVIPVATALQFGQTSHRIKVRGVVTYQDPGHSLYLQNGADGIQVQTFSTALVDFGKVVEAVGFPVMGQSAPILQDGAFHIVGNGTPVVPQLIDARDVITQRASFNYVPYDAQLVQLQGEVVEKHIQAGQRVWILRQKNEVFEAYLPLSADAGKANKVGLGSIVLISGICTVHSDAEHNPISFSILMRSEGDIVVLKQAFWWTTTRTLILLSILAGVTMVVTLWVVILKKRVEQQTRTIRASEGRFRELAERDVLTGLPNRFMLEDRIAGILAHAKEVELRAAVLTVDIDRFKQINDRFGHLTGDECLKVVANRLRSRVRAIDIIARTGGEEFTLVIGRLKNVESVRTVANTLLELFSDPVTVTGHELKITISIGIALYPDDGLDAEALRKRSDQALYEAKRTGRNRAIFASDEISRSCELPTAIESSLREAVRSNGFYLFYQPICDASGAIYCFEALIRTNDPWLTELGPSGYIPVAEESGLIIPMGGWVLEEACRQIAEWQSVGIYCPVAVNISGLQLLQSDFVEDLLKILERFKIQPGMLVLELTETTAMTDLTVVTEAVAQLAAAGITFAIDDFGIGYSSLSRLNELPLKFLKIDRSFIERLEKNNRAHVIIAAVLQMAKSLRLHVVAEGVERVEQFEMMHEMGCEYFQGYLFAPAADAALTTKMLAGDRTVLMAESLLSRQAS